MPDHWDTRPEDLFSPPDEQPDPAPNNHHDHPTKIKLTDDRGQFRLPAYILISLGIAAAALLLVTVGLLIMPS